MQVRLPYSTYLLVDSNGPDRADVSNSACIVLDKVEWAICGECGVGAGDDGICDCGECGGATGLARVCLIGAGLNIS